MPDDLDRDNMYRGDSAEDDDAEYELEPPDAEVLAAEQRRAKETIASVKHSIDIDEIYRDYEGRDSPSLDNLFKDVHFRFQFQVKHLLIGTAILAVLITLTKATGFATILVLLIMLGVGGATLFLQWQEHKRQQEADRRRQRLYAERRARWQNQRATGGDDNPTAESAPVAPLPPDDFDAARQQAAAGQKYRLRFSRDHVIAAVICTAAVFALTYALGGVQTTATFCGFLALLGLVVHAFGYQPPEVVAFVWWVTLLAYVILSILTTIFRMLGL